MAKSQRTRSKRQQGVSWDTGQEVSGTTLRQPCERKSEQQDWGDLTKSDWDQEVNGRGAGP